jgi:hypothetical protein
LGAKVIIEVPQPLIEITAGLAGVSQVICKGEAPPSFDYHCPLMSLPTAFKTDLRSIPFPERYVNTSSYEDRLSKWSDILGSTQKPKIGITWSGNPNHKNDQNRSISLELLMNHLPNNFEYICLQKEIQVNDLATLNESNVILDVSAHLNDFSDTAALIHSLDLVITVDTSLAHLSGAIGQKTWLLLPFVPDWRWLLNREDSPWYSSLRLYRQKTSNEWGGVLEQISSDIKQFT